MAGNSSPAERTREKQQAGTVVIQKAFPGFGWSDDRLSSLPSRTEYYPIAVVIDGIPPMNL